MYRRRNDLLIVCRTKTKMFKRLCTIKKLILRNRIADGNASTRRVLRPTAIKRLKNKMKGRNLHTRRSSYYRRRGQEILRVVALVGRFGRQKIKNGLPILTSSAALYFLFIVNGSFYLFFNNVIRSGFR